MVKSIISDKLPEKYVERHNLMLYLYDILVDILRKADEYNLSDTVFSGDMDIKNVTFDSIDKRESIELGAELNNRHILFSILSDMCHYLYESLSCIERGKVTVAYTLARKPLQDNLYYLCWILDNPSDFYKKMKNEEPVKYDVSTLKSNEKNVIAMYNRIINKINKDKLVDFQLFTAETLYELIYDKASNKGLSQIFDRSIHLVTGNRHYKTERKNLNFVFVDDEIWDEYWEYYYLKVPYIIMFIVEVVTKNVEVMLLIPEKVARVNHLIRGLKFEIALNLEEKNIAEEELNYVLKKSLTIVCDKCGNNMLKSEETIREFKEEYLFACSKCGNVERIGQYFISDELLEERIVLEVENKNNIYELKAKYKRRDNK